MRERMAVIGDYSAVGAFAAIGVEVYDCQSKEQAVETIRLLTKEQYAVIFLTETLAEQIQDTLEKAKQHAYPVILVIPLNEQNNGYGMKSIKRDVEKALGIDILFNKEDK